MKTTFKLIGLIAIAIIALAFFGCKEEPDPTPQEIKREFEITLLDKKVVVKDSRTDKEDESLEELGIIAKLEAAAVLINASTAIDKDVFNKILKKGMVIIIEEPTAPYNNSNSIRCLDDGKTMLFDINYINSTEVLSNNVAGRINNAIVNYLDKGLELTKATQSATKIQSGA